MKKRTRKLSLKKETIRTLAGAKLSRVAGGTRALPAANNAAQVVNTNQIACNFGAGQENYDYTETTLTSWMPTV